jgi:nitrite reductase/ring-hydroxylating ferredoxin subunit
MKWHKLPLAVINSKQPIQQLQLDGQKFCLVYHKEEWHATSHKCPHAGANLAGGWCVDGQLICPYHRHSFDLSHGKGAAGQHNSITIYRIQHREDGIYIELPQSIFRRWLNALQKS